MKHLKSVRELVAGLVNYSMLNDRQSEQSSLTSSKLK